MKFHRNNPSNFEISVPLFQGPSFNKRRNKISAGDTYYRKYDIDAHPDGFFFSISSQINRTENETDMKVR